MRVEKQTVDPNLLTCQFAPEIDPAALTKQSMVYERVIDPLWGAWYDCWTHVNILRTLLKGDAP